MSDQEKLDNQDQNHSETDLKRRKITKAAIASPIVASLSTTPVFGCSVSGFLSGNTSENHTPYTCSGNGCTPGFWKTNIEAWPPSISPGTCKVEINNKCKEWNPGTGTKFTDILPTNGCADSFATAYGYTSYATIMEILLKEVSGGGNTNSVLAHYIAAILNSMSSPVYGSSVEEIQLALCKAINKGKVEEYKDILDALNNRGCFLDAHGDCAEPNFVLAAGVCIPACPDGTHFDEVAVACVPD